MDQVNGSSEAGCSRGLCPLPAESLNSVCQRAPRAITLQEAPPHRPLQLTLMSPLPPCLAAMSNLPPHHQTNPCCQNWGRPRAARGARDTNPPVLASTAPPSPQAFGVCCLCPEEAKGSYHFLATWTSVLALTLVSFFHLLMI